MEYENQETILQLEHIKKSFGDTDILTGINLEVRRGEFITLLGASGCGKTTTLRIIAGMEQPDHGRVLLEGQDVTSLDPNKRSVNMVFQNYALFPHMSVAQNIGYSLRLRRKKKAEIQSAVTKALQLVQLSGYEKRMPKELSGGEKQRVAIARAVVNQPRILLLDEPLGALDLQLRRQMQTELKHLQKKLGITFIYITHDQEEALNMSDRIVVMRNGRFEQTGSPSEIYDKPHSSYVARFVGNANILRGEVKNPENGMFWFEYFGASLTASAHGAVLRHGQAITLAVRSEQIELVPDCKGSQCPGLNGTVLEKTFAGGMLRIVVELAGGDQIIASRHGIDSGFSQGDHVTVSWPAKSAVPVDLEETNG